MLGQHSSALAHLNNHGVGPGDLFLFFGLFRPAERSAGRWRFVPGSLPFHSLWGWLQVAEVWSLDGSVPVAEWAGYHPHMHGERPVLNSLYVSRSSLAIPGVSPVLPGAGVFDQLTSLHRLTAPDARQATDWQLPAAFMPTEGHGALSYHQNPDRWRHGDNPGTCRLRSAARGQEFVLDLDWYPGVTEWLATPGLFDG
jgi:hypothetical protein